MLVQAFVPEFPIQTFDKGILCRLAWLNETQFGARLLLPEKHPLTGEFCPVVANYLFRQSSRIFELIKKTRYLMARNRKRSVLAYHLSGIVVDDVEYSKSPTIRQLVTDKIHRPADIAAGGDQHWHSRPYQFLAFPGAQLKP